MHWIEACSKSSCKKAIRRDKKDGSERIMIRSFEDASISINNGKFREAFPEEVEGYLDWKPWR